MRPRPRAPPAAALSALATFCPSGSPFPRPPLLPTPTPILLLLPDFPFLLPIVLFPSLLFLRLPGPSSLCSATPRPTSDLFVLPFCISLSSAPCPSPAFLCGCPSPPPHCPVWPKDKSQGETSKDKQGAVTSLSSLICHFSSSHKGQSRHGLNSGLTGRLGRRPAFGRLPLPR